MASGSFFEVGLTEKLFILGTRPVSRRLQRRRHIPVLVARYHPVLGLKGQYDCTTSQFVLGF